MNIWCLPVHSFCARPANQNDLFYYDYLSMFNKRWKLRHYFIGCIWWINFTLTKAKNFYIINVTYDKRDIFSTFFFVLFLSRFYARSFVIQRLLTWIEKAMNVCTSPIKITTAWDTKRKQLNKRASKRTKVKWVGMNELAKI